MDKKRRQELQEQYANRKQPTGVFAVRNSASGEVWVGHSKNLDVQKNGLWARLAGGACFNRGKGMPIVDKQAREAWPGPRE